jgi:hypothetical protein
MRFILGYDRDTAKKMPFYLDCDNQLVGVWL